MSLSRSRSMREGADVVVKTCLAVQEGEDLVVVADRSSQEIGLALAESGRAAGAEVSLIVIAPRQAHAQDPPAPVIAAMCKADAAILATLFSLSNSNGRREATSHGTRIISMPGCREETLTAGAILEDFEGMLPTVRAVGARLSRATDIRVRTANGTDLRIRLCGRRSVDQTGMARKPGSWAPCPNLETAVGLSMDGTDGVMIVDGALIPGGVPEEPVCVKIHRGKVCAIEGGSAADKLDRLLRSFKDPNVYQVVEFGIGLNRMARIGRGLMAEDESQFGTVHLGLGDGRTFGLPIDAPTHVDLVIRRPDVYIDGKIMVHNEKLVGAFEIEDIKGHGVYEY